MPAQKPSLELLRQLTDTHVVEALVDGGRLTRAEVAARTGLSKPTVTESVRRLELAGVVVDTGERSEGRGRAGLYYDLAPTLGTALAVAIAPEGVVVEAVDVRGQVVARQEAQVERPAKPAAVARVLARTTGRVVQETGAATRLAVVSAADPVDRRTGRLVHLPDAPFLVGELDPAQALAGVVAGPVTVGNDVNWSALAERSGAHEPLDSFAYLYLGEGLGCAVVADGAVLQGAGGLAGEVSHVVVAGARGVAVPFTEVFDQLGLRHPGTTAIDVPRLVALADGSSAQSRRTVATLATAVAGVVSAVVALADPAVVVLGGSWATHPAVVAAVRGRVDSSRRPVPVRPAEVPDAALAGARAQATRSLREQLVRLATGAAEGTRAPRG